MDRIGRHAISIVWNPSLFRGLAGRKGLPELIAPLLSTSCGPVHHMRRPFIRPQEEDFLPFQVVFERIIRQNNIEQSIYVFLECLVSRPLRIQVEQERPLGAAFGYVLVLPLLGHSKMVVLIENEIRILLVILGVPRPHDADPAAGDIPKSYVKSVKLLPEHHEKAFRGLLVSDGIQEGRRAQAKGKRALLFLVEVRFQHGVIEQEEELQYRPVNLKGNVGKLRLAFLWCGACFRVKSTGEVKIKFFELIWVVKDGLKNSVLSIRVFREASS